MRSANAPSSGSGNSGLIRFPTSADASPGGPPLHDTLEDPLLASEPPTPVGARGGGGGGEHSGGGGGGATPSDGGGGGAHARHHSPSWPKRAAAAWQRLMRGAAPPPPPRYRSGYLTLIPLSDARLQPRRTRLAAALALAFALLIAGCVFVATPRSVSIGTLDMHSIRMHFNASTMNYRIVLGAKVPVINPNYYSASVSGNLSISYYDVAAGWQDFSASIPARSFPTPVRVRVDASNLPGKYTAVVIGNCLNFPRRIIFFLTAAFRARVAWWAYDLPTLDSYFMLDCSDANAALKQGGWVELKQLARLPEPELQRGGGRGGGGSGEYGGGTL